MKDDLEKKGSECSGCASSEDCFADMALKKKGSRRGALTALLGGAVTAAVSSASAAIDTDEEKELKTEPVFELSLFEIMRAFREIMSEFESQPVSEIIPEEFTIDEKIAIVLELVGDGRQATFKELFTGSSSKLEIVVTFIAVLELMKRAHIKCKQEGAFKEIWIYRTDPPEDDDELGTVSLDEEYGDAASPDNSNHSPGR